MIIIVEGNEGTGKTTLIKELLKRLPLVSIKYSKDIVSTNGLYFTLLNLDEDVILDRSFITDMVYRSCDGDKPQMTLEQVAYFLNRTNSDIRIIFCHTDKGFDYAQQRGEDFITDLESYNEIESHFIVIEDLIKAYTDIPCYDYDFEYETVDDVINFIQRKEEA